MSLVSERLRSEDRARLRGMTAAERVAEALALGDAAIAAFAAARGLDLEEARRRLELGAQAGRLPSRIMREVVA